MPRSIRVRLWSAMHFIWPPRTACTSSRQSSDPKRALASSSQCRGASTVAEQGREHDNHQRRPYRIHREVGDLPLLQRRKRAAATQEGRIEPRRPRQVDEQNEILAKGGHSIWSEAKLGN